MNIPESFSLKQLRLRGFSRSLAELEWLLLILVLLYYVAPGSTMENRFGLVMSMVAFALFVLAFRYAKFFTRESHEKLAVESWAMILFVSYAAYNSGGINSPLLNLYLLVIIASALTLGKMVTLLEFALITLVYFFMGYPEYFAHGATVEEFSHVMILFAPYLLVGYVTTMLASDVHYGIDMLESISQTDELTGLNNRRAFNELVQSEAKKAGRYNHPYSVMMIDIDDLKQINDSIGHEAGDRLLRIVANVMKETFRATDMLARYGGDEFIVLLTETDAEYAREAGDRVKTAIANTSVNMDGHAISSTVSIGLASFPEDSGDVDEIMKRADQALYQSKSDGKNTMTLWRDMA